MIYNCSYPFKPFISFYTYFFFLGVLFVLFLFVFYKSRVWEKSLFLTFFGLSFLILGGGYNLYSFHTHGCVVDPFPFFGLFFFNLADLLVVGGLLLLSTLYIIRRPTEKKGEIR